MCQIMSNLFTETYFIALMCTLNVEIISIEPTVWPSQCRTEEVLSWAQSQRMNTLLIETIHYQVQSMPQLSKHHLSPPYHKHYSAFCQKWNASQIATYTSLHHLWRCCSLHGLLKCILALFNRSINSHSCKGQNIFKPNKCHTFLSAFNHYHINKPWLLFQAKQALINTFWNIAQPAILAIYWNLSNHNLLVSEHLINMSSCYMKTSELSLPFQSICPLLWRVHL